MNIKDIDTDDLISELFSEDRGISISEGDEILKKLDAIREDDIDYSDHIDDLDTDEMIDELERRHLYSDEIDRLAKLSNTSSAEDIEWANSFRYLGLDDDDWNFFKDMSMYGRIKWKEIRDALKSGLS